MKQNLFGEMSRRTDCKVLALFACLAIGFAADEVTEKSRNFELALTDDFGRVTKYKVDRATLLKHLLGVDHEVDGETLAGLAGDLDTFWGLIGGILVFGNVKSIENLATKYFSQSFLQSCRQAVLAQCFLFCTVFSAGRLRHA